MPTKGHRRFDLLTQPAPLPDADDAQAQSAPVSPSPQRMSGGSPAAAERAPRRRKASTAAAAPATPQPAAATRPAALSPPDARAASTVRLRPSAAEPLNAAWLAERQTNNPKLSYPEFASMIVSLGLAAYEQQKSS